jgi:rare lipoprotein A
MAPGILLAACATAPERPAPAPSQPAPPSARAEPAPQAPTARRPATGNPPFYEVMGERYHVLDDSVGYAEQGIASWYGREFHGRPTSSGETYDMYALTAAHKTLPLPTTARVTNLATGKSIVVRINDRGPFKKGRIIDLSYGAARELGFLNAGTALVEVEALEDSAGSGAVTGDTGNVVRHMYVQVGAFGQPSNAEQLKRRLESQGVRNVVIRYDAGGQGAAYRVRIGPVADAAEYDAVVARVAKLDIGDARLVVETTSTDRGVPAAAEPGLPGG